MSQKIASASASGSTSGFFRASSAGSTGRQSSPPAAALSPPAPVAASNTPKAANRINREFRCRERWDFIAEAFRWSCAESLKGFPDASLESSRAFYHGLWEHVEDRDFLCR